MRHVQYVFWGLSNVLFELTNKHVQGTLLKGTNVWIHDVYEKSKDKNE